MVVVGAGGAGLRAAMGAAEKVCSHAERSSFHPSYSCHPNESLRDSLSSLIFLAGKFFHDTDD